MAYAADQFRKTFLGSQLLPASIQSQAVFADLQFSANNEASQGSLTKITPYKVMKKLAFLQPRLNFV